MANVKLIFQGTKATDSQLTELECSNRFENYVTITIKEDGGESTSYISLDIPTAIKFSKVLRTEINKAKEVSNG